MIERYVLGFEEIDKTQVALAGGKGANLGELSQVEGIDVPAGFCVTTDAFAEVMAAAPGIDDRLERLSRLDPEDRQAIQALSAEIRRAIEQVAIPGELAAEITRSVDRLGVDAAYAVRSSATAEDLPGASFAGQQDSYLNVVGVAAILTHVSRCWASLFTERAVTYRQRNGFDHRRVRMAVVVQQMVLPQAAGVAFTADPVTSSRTIVSIEAVFGLGEALVSGLVNADVYKVRDGQVVSRTVAAEQPALTDEQILRLARLSRRIEAHFGYPQDVRVVPGRRRVPDCPEPADHHAVPHSGDRRSGKPRLHLGRSPADDDRPDEAPRARLLAADHPAADGQGRRPAVRERHCDAGLACEPGRPAQARGPVRSADR